MSHEIEVTEDGLAKAMYSNSPAWHRLGQIFDRNGQTAANSQEAMELAGLNTTVKKEPIYLTDGTKIDDFVATVRQEDRKTLGIVTDQYQVFQNNEAFSFLDELIQDGIMKYESAFSLKGGKKITLLARLPSFDTIAENDHLLRYIMFSTTHDGSGSIICCPTSVRVVCANTQRVAEWTSKSRGHLFSIRHSGNLDSKLKVAQQYLSQFDKAFTLYKDASQTLVKEKFSKTQVKEYLQKLFPIPDKSEDNKITRWNTKMTQILNSIDQTNQLGSIRGSWWSLFNGVTGWVDHEMTSKGRDNRARMENRFLSVSNGNKANLKDTAFKLALEMAA